MSRLSQRFVSGFSWPRTRPARLLWLGVAIRLLTFVTLGPDLVDAHSQVLKFLLRSGSLPHTHELHEAFQPPLYYLLAAPFLAVTGYAKGAQILSLVISIATLFAFYLLLYRRTIILSEKARLYSLTFVALLPQFVMFSLFVSNDTLIIFIGAITMLQAYQFAERPDRRNLVLLSVLAGLGLLTKATFVAALPVLALLVVVCTPFGGAKRIAPRVAVFLLLAFSIGCYKYIDNQIHEKNAFVTNMDMLPTPSWAVEQARWYRGWRGLEDINVTSLIAEPLLSDRTKGSPLLMLYATYWYPHTPLSSYGWSNPPLRLLGSCVYLFSLVPASTFAVGLVSMILRISTAFKTFVKGNRILEAGQAVSFAAFAIFILNCILILLGLAKYHLWSITDSRLSFPSFLGGLVAFSAGVDVFSRYRLSRAALQVAMYSLGGLFLCYLASEFSLTVYAFARNHR